MAHYYQSHAAPQEMKIPGEIIRAEIQENGAISFARFMELALYSPETGYYERNPHGIGRTGDFITSVSTGRLFGELLAFQLAEWLAALPPAAGRCRLVETGAHDGKLAANILRWLQSRRPSLAAQVEYGILEPSPNRQAWQRATLESFAPRVRWFTDFENLITQTHPAKFHGIIFSNELLDAFPVRRLGWDAGARRWFEWGVALAGGEFIWTRRAEPVDDLLPVPAKQPELQAVLPDGYTIEISPAAENWWRAAAGILECGKLLTIDYGLTATEQFSPARTRGTLRAYGRQQVTEDVLARPGEQDLTAHVNFSTLQKTGEDAGLTTDVFCPQPQFLTRIAEKTFPPSAAFGEWDATRTRQFQTLTHPDHMGRAFRVLVQSR
jgi:SAM-dependent MidA family methyltransferase